jgi:hypothetical protein
MFWWKVCELKAVSEKTTKIRDIWVLKLAIRTTPARTIEFCKTHTISVTVAYSSQTHAGCHGSEATANMHQRTLKFDKITQRS